MRLGRTRTCSTIITLIIVACSVSGSGGSECASKWKRTLSPSRWIGWASGALDVVGANLLLLVERERFFSDGIGDLDAIKGTEEMISALCKGRGKVPEIKNLTWEPVIRERPHLEIREATFDTPFADCIPEKCCKARFQLILPKEKEVHAVVVAFQRTSEEGFHKGRALLSQLSSTGIATVLVLAPMLVGSTFPRFIVVELSDIIRYGKRRPPGQKRYFYRTVSSFLQSTFIGIIEGAMIVDWCRNRFPDTPICLSGISAGAVAAAGTALAVKEPVAVVTYAGPASGRPFVHGVLSKYVNWSSLTDSLRGTTRDEAEQFLLQLFASKHLQKMTDWRKEAGVNPSLISINVEALNDRCVLPLDSEELHKALQGASNHIEVRRVYGGHFCIIQKAKSKFVPVIELAIKQLQERLSS